MPACRFICSFQNCSCRHSRCMRCAKLMSVYTGSSPAGGQWCPAPHLKSVSPISRMGPPVAAYIQYCIWKMWSPLLVFGPSIWFLAPLLLNPGDGPVSTWNYLLRPWTPPQGASSEKAIWSLRIRQKHRLLAAKLLRLTWRCTVLRRTKKAEIDMCAFVATTSRHLPAVQAAGFVRTERCFSFGAMPQPQRLFSCESFWFSLEFLSCRRFCHRKVWSLWLDD